MAKQELRNLLKRRSLSTEDDMKELSILIRSVDLNSEPFLVQASQYQPLNVIRMLLDYGANIDIQDNFGTTALMKSAGFGKYRLVELLLDRKADPNLQDKDGSTALMYAILFNPQEGSPVYDRFITTIRILLSDRNTNVDIRDSDGNTALIHASINGNTTIVNELLYSKANPFIKNKDDLTSYDLASNDDVRRLIRKYESGENVDIQRMILLSSIRGRPNSGDGQRVYIPPKMAKEISKFLFRSTKKSRKPRKKLEK